VYRYGCFEKFPLRTQTSNYAIVQSALESSGVDAGRVHKEIVEQGLWVEIATTAFAPYRGLTL